MTPGLLHHRVPVDVGQQTEAKPIHDGEHENGEGDDGDHDEDGDGGDDSLFQRLKTTDQYQRNLTSLRLKN